MDSTSARPRHWPLAGVLCLLVGCQIALGGATYVVKYAFPSWLQGFSYSAAFVVQEKSLTQALVTTTHVATGSLILFVATALATIAVRPFFAIGSSSAPSAAQRWRVAPVLTRSAAA